MHVQLHTYIHIYMYKHWEISRCAKRFRPFFWPAFTKKNVWHSKRIQVDTDVVTQTDTCAIHVEEKEEEEEVVVQAAEKTCVLNEYSMSSQAVKKTWTAALKGKRGEKIYSMNHEIIRVIYFSKFPDRYLLLSNRSFFSFSLSRQSHFVQV